MIYLDEYLAKWGKIYLDQDLQEFVTFEKFLEQPEAYADYHDDTFVCNGCGLKLRGNINRSLCSTCAVNMCQGDQYEDK